MKCLMVALLISTAVLFSSVVCSQKLVKSKASRHADVVLDWVEGRLELGNAGGMVECEVCSRVAKTMTDLVRKGRKKEAALYLETVCVEISASPVKICRGLVNMYRQTYEESLSRTKLTPREFCAFMTSWCPDRDSEAFRWKVELPRIPKPPVRPIPTPPPGSPRIRVLHLADVHWDPRYAAGSRANCADPLCCRVDEDGSRDRIVRAGSFGTNLFCDLPMVTLQSALRDVEDVEYVIMTGDLPPHDIWNQTRSGQLAVISDIVDALSRHLPPGTKVFPALGNHETVPCNSFPPDYVTDENSVSWLLGPVSRLWSRWVPDPDKTLLRFGYYSVPVRPGLTLISLNMNLCMGLNVWLSINMTDPNAQLAWLVRQLQTAEDNGDVIHIIGHVPPRMCYKEWSWQYFNITLRYESTIGGQFFGHTHNDDVVVACDPAGGFVRATGVHYISPSLTTYSGRYPTYRIYEVDGRPAAVNGTFAVLDHHTYFLNVTRANEEGIARWEREYSAKGFYSLPSLQPPHWLQLVTKFQNEDFLFQSYYQFRYGLSPFSTSYRPRECGRVCKSALLCDMRSGRADDPAQCGTNVTKSGV